ncbi:hypothetical protein [Niabella drilacis]|uniref:Quinol oxidase subunit 4 n=1 Tax=Niabella drilacis (strain DSM 25811 / CCM 8410 / CCUG 62505 / LMG 26954 / E90) TaxID=1285928 RepID=A0A1G7AUB9_NIADE|nr:hypothetical protein [Niabella drilacis]SDE18429.1 hypothetical protein SAMN04487894_12525 [Niabella drilacis]
MNTLTLKLNKSRLVIWMIALLTVAGLSSCTEVYYPSYGYYDRGQHYRRMPPGQAKKYYGAKSARDFAPGHNKRYYRY